VWPAIKSPLTKKDREGRDRVLDDHEIAAIWHACVEAFRARGRHQRARACRGNSPNAQGRRPVAGRNPDRSHADLARGWDFFFEASAAGSTWPLTGH